MDAAGAPLRRDRDPAGHGLRAVPTAGRPGVLAQPRRSGVARSSSCACTARTRSASSSCGPTSTTSSTPPAPHSSDTGSRPARCCSPAIRWARPSQFAGLLLELRRFARSRGLKLAALGASEALVPIYEELGLRTMYLGDEAMVEPPDVLAEGARSARSASRSAACARPATPPSCCTLGEIDAADAGADATVLEAGRIGKDERGFSMCMDGVDCTNQQDTLFVLARDGEQKRPWRPAFRSLLRASGDVAVDHAPGSGHAQRPDGVPRGLGDRGHARARGRGAVVELRGAHPVHPRARNGFERVLGRTASRLNPIFRSRASTASTSNSSHAGNRATWSTRAGWDWSAPRSPRCGRRGRCPSRGCPRIAGTRRSADLKDRESLACAAQRLGKPPPNGI